MRPPTFIILSKLDTDCGWLGRTVSWCKRGDRPCDCDRTVTRTGPSKATPDWVKLLLSHSLRVGDMDYDGIEIARVKLGRGETDAEGGHLTLCGGMLVEIGSVQAALCHLTRGVLSSIAIITRAAFSPWPLPPSGISSFWQRSSTGSWKRCGPSQEIPQIECWKGVRGRITMVVVHEHLTCGLI